MGTWSKAHIESQLWQPCSNTGNSWRKRRIRDKTTEGQRKQLIFVTFKFWFQSKALYGLTFVSCTWILKRLPVISLNKSSFTQLVLNLPTHLSRFLFLVTTQALRQWNLKNNIYPERLSDSLQVIHILMGQALETRSSTSRHSTYK